MNIKYVVVALAAAAAVPASAQAITMAQYAQRANAICAKYEKRDRVWLAKMRGATPLRMLGKAWLAISRIDAQAYAALKRLRRPVGDEISAIIAWLAARRQLVNDEKAIGQADSQAWSSARQSGITDAYTNHTLYYRYWRDILGVC
jgi:hypothetical protein